VASSSWTCAAVSPTPLSVTRSVPSPVTSGVAIAMRAGVPGAPTRRAVIASIPFCSSSRR
jgi:hypothetical protein